MRFRVCGRDQGFPVALDLRIALILWIALDLRIAVELWIALVLWIAVELRSIEPSESWTFGTLDFRKSAVIQLPQAAEKAFFQMTVTNEAICPAGLSLLRERSISAEGFCIFGRQNIFVAI